MVSSIKCSREVKKTNTIFLRAYGTDEVHAVMDIQNSRLSRVVLTVCRLQWRREGGMRPGWQFAGAALEGAKIWNSEILLLLANWRLH